MHRERLPLQVLPAWLQLANGTFSNVEVQPIQHKGNGLVAQASSVDIGQSPVITIPHDLVLNAEAVEEYAKEDSNFRLLLEACGHKSPRHDILLFLLVHLVLSSRPANVIGLRNSWTEYVKMLDDEVPVPTLWTEDERLLLHGTSLEPALDAKMTALTREFDELREKSSEIEIWYLAFWESNLVQLTDWYRVDAWYRSRVLELPRPGPSLVPCLDMANHSAEANAYYEETSDGEVVLLLRPDANLEKDGEVTISYGSEKSAAEMLFSYGFLDTSSAVRTLTLPLSPLPDDPLGKAKVHIFDGTPSVQIKEVDGEMEWTSPFAYLMCLNEEDGLGFQIMQSSDGGRELRLFWQDEDVTDTIDTFEKLVAGHDLCDVFRLRVNMVVSQRLQEQSDQLVEGYTAAEEADGSSENATSARELMSIEGGILEETLKTLEDQKTRLLALDSVTAYLEAMNAPADSEDVAQNDETGENEFS